MDEKKILIAFFSMTKDYSFGNTERLIKGHTEQVAEHIAEVTGGKLYRINPTEALQKEKEYHPQPLTDFETYDTVYIGYPIYYHKMPQMVTDFIESHDFSGKVIIPFSTHAGSGLGGTVEVIRYLCPDSTVKQGRAVGSAQVQTDKTNIQKWALESLK